MPVHDLHAEIDLLDAARAAIAARAGARALDLLLRYEDRYPTGSFRPEAAAVRVEALGPDRHTRLLVRTRTGYYAPREASVASGQ